MADGDVLGNVVSSAANQRRFPVLAARAPPTTYVRPVPQAAPLATLSPRTPYAPKSSEANSQAAQLDQLTNANSATRPVFAPCNPGQAREAIAMPRCVLPVLPDRRASAAARLRRWI